MRRDDRQLLVGIARGRNDCALELWARHGKAMTSLARAIVGPDAAEDVVQAALCQILRVPVWRLKAVDDAAPWLAGLVRHQSLNFLRTERRLRQRGRRAAQNVESSVRAPQSDSLTGRVDALPRRLREVVVLKLVAGLTFDQLARALSVPRGTVAARYRAALAKLRIEAPPESAPPASGVFVHG
ncbi:MAG: sigma-70 family RNA polymerase sigma factor [Phycisphaerales bacterium]|nr:sigma-70 family RNA polymerase sigma factor [Planctomycetota bacterium]